MSNRYQDTVILAVDSANQLHVVEHYNYASYGCGYVSMTFVNGKSYTVQESAYEDDEGRVDMCTKKEGEYLPWLWEHDCCSFFSSRPSNNMKRIIKEAELDKTDIVKLISLVFESTSGCIYSAEGCVITKAGKKEINRSVFEQVIPSEEDLAWVVDSIISQLN